MQFLLDTHILSDLVKRPQGAVVAHIAAWGRKIFNGKVNLHYSIRHQSLNSEAAMTLLTVTERGQVTFRKDVLQHLGIRPGEKIELDLLPDGRGILKAARPAGSIEGFVGLLAGRTNKIASLAEINAATEQGWVGKE
jgi:bifunctional DNA-binding transcriptional regulator/antitoxin component of YhaV-PrlF toxin-antitoxin module